VPLFIDRHDLSGASAADVAAAHTEDVRRGRLTMKGFDEPIRLFEVAWQEPTGAGKED
jgi:class 3 adenylate cyclase